MNVTPPADQAVRDRIEAELDRTFFVDAGAGSGKTTSLVNRVVALVESGVPLESIAVITFTEAAAGELRHRIRERLGAERSDELDAAPIATLHGFAQRLLRSFPIQAGLPPDIEILDEVASRIEFERCWIPWLTELESNPDMVPILERLDCLGVRVPVALEALAHALAEDHDRLDLVPRLPAVPLEAIELASVRAALDLVDDTVANRPPTVPDDDKFLAWYHDRFQPLAARVRHAAERVNGRAADRRAERERDSALISALSELTKLKGRPAGTAPDWGSPASARRALVDAINLAATDSIAGAIQQACEVIAGRIADFVDHAAQERARHGRLVFSDLLVLARNLLRDHPDVRAAANDRYRHVLLDEFQDTDPIQIELATLIASLDESVGEGRLFFVGDPKQSIYRFRRADIDLYLSTREQFRSGGLSLTVNFRSLPGIIEFVNAVFGHVFDGSSTTQAPFEPLTAHRSAANGAGPPLLPAVQLVGGQLDEPAEECRRLGAADVAALLADHLHPDTPPRWLVAEESGPPRTAGLDDIAILIPSRLAVSTLERALDDAGVPYRLETSSLIWSAQEIRDLLAVLRVLHDPTDEVALLAALRSPLLGCTDVDLLEWKTGGGAWNFAVGDRVGDRDREPAGAGGPVGAGDSAVGQAFGRLRSLHSRRWWLTPDALAEIVLDELGGWVLAMTSRRPAEPMRRLRYVIDQARAVSKGSVGADLGTFLRWSALAASESTARASRPLPEPDEPCVRIMTIHAAKGREFPVVVLAGLGSRPPNNTGVRVLWDPTSDAPQVKFKAGIATPMVDVLAPAEDAMSAEERLRLLYVAATRARDALVVTLHHSAGAARSMAGKLSDAINVVDPCDDGIDDDDDARPAPPPRFARVEVPPLVPLAPAVDAPIAPGPLDDAAVAGPLHWRERRAQLVASAGPSVWSATAVARSALASEPHRAGSVDDERAGAERAGAEPAPEEPTTYRRGRAGTAIGRATHATLQLLDLASESVDDRVASVAAAQAAIEALGGAEAETVERLARTALASPLVKWAASHPHHREMFVAVPVDETVLEGYVDLLVTADDGSYVVIDYKTDSVRSPTDADAAVERYRLQGASYALAVAEATGRPVSRVVFLFLSGSAAIERDITDLPGAVAEVRDLISPAAAVSPAAASAGVEGGESVEHAGERIE